MKKLVIFYSMLAAAVLTACSQSSVAYQDEHVRFTMISEGAVRMEWAENGEFTDARSFLATERQYPHVRYSVSRQDSVVRISTAKMEIRYVVGSDSLTARNLQITSAQGADVPFCWYPGLPQTDNLGGTLRTLDGCNGEICYAWNEERRAHDTVPVVLEDGLLARCGWTLLDDSHNFLFTDEELPWVATRPEQKAQDWYFLAYGHDYKQALYDYTLFAGRIPEVPTYAFGYWWSRFWKYTQRDFEELVEHFEERQIPLDVMVIDMDWHYSDWVRGGWTGYNWNRDLIADPDSLLRFLHAHGLRTTLNLHPADGIKTWEECYPAVAEALGITDGEDIPWQGSDRAFMDAWWTKVLRPLQEQGVDFWWLDWQQWPYDKQVPGLSNTWWLNYYVFTRQGETSDTPMLYHRWGGLGNHRYQVGFSGDSYSTWESLRFQPYFNHTASNVLYGYWSHDIGGHMLLNDTDTLNEELYVRWMQFGCFSPILRTHSTADSRMTKEPWAQSPEVERILTQTIRLRYSLIPYIERMARVASETGVSLCRPLYYDYPEAEEAYMPCWRNEYMFGDDMLVCPIVEPMQDGVSQVDVWLPEGEWEDFFHHHSYRGGQVYHLEYTLEDYPVFLLR